MTEISNNDLFTAIKELATDVNEVKKTVGSIEDRVTDLEKETKAIRTEMNEMKVELKHDIRKVDEKVGRLSNELLDAKADISLLQKEVY